MPLFQWLNIVPCVTVLIIEVVRSRLCHVSQSRWCLVQSIPFFKEMPCVILRMVRVVSIMSPLGPINMYILSLTPHISHNFFSAISSKSLVQSSSSSLVRYILFSSLGFHLNPFSKQLCLSLVIVEYQDVSSRSGDSYESGEGSTSGSNSSSSSHKHYSSGVPGFSLEKFQEMQRRTAFGTGVSSSRRPPSPLQDVEQEEEGEEDEDVIYSCAPEVASTLDELKLKTLVDRYQIPREFKPHLPNEGEWCCCPSSGLGVYTSYLLAGLRFPLNSFCRALLIGQVLDLISSTPMVGG